MDTSLHHAEKLDAQDQLAHFRDEFFFADENTIYLDGNSLGRLPKRTRQFMQKLIDKEWGDRLIRSWNDSWVNTPSNLGAKIAKLIGAQEDEVIVTESTSTNLFKLAVAALRYQEGRKKIISDTLNFPSDLYILQGIIDLLGKAHTLELIPTDDGISPNFDSLQNTLNDDTALLSLTHVAFKSAFMYDMKKITEAAHKAGALMLWDLSHSVGAVPLELNKANVDLAIGCTYKYLNGGPGAPAFLYVRRDLQKKLLQPIWGWFADKNPFAFDLKFTPSEDISRFRIGTPPILSMKAIEPALDIILEAGMDNLRKKSIAQTQYLIALVEAWLLPLGFQLGSPKDAQKRGSHISLRHPESFRISRALIESVPPAIQVIPDFRAPDNIRLGITPLYNSFADIHKALERIRIITEEKIYEAYTTEKMAVT